MDYKVHKCELHNESKTMPSMNEYTCDVTRFMDEHSLHLKNSPYKSDSTYRYMCTTYLLQPEQFKSDCVISFRVPGATRGCIVVDKVDVDGQEGYQIKEFRFIPSTCFSETIGCYEQSIVDDVKQFIGDVIMF